MVDMVTTRAVRALAVGSGDDAVRLATTADWLGAAAGRHADARLRLAEFAAHRNDYAVSERLFAALRGEAPTDATVCVSLARVHLLQGKFEAARDLLAPLVRQQPQNADALAILAAACASLDLPDDARRFASRALAIAPSHPIAQSIIKRTGLASGAVPSRAPATHLEKAEALFSARRLPEALVEYQRAIADAPDNASAYLGAGDAHYFMGKPHLAAAFFEESVAIAPRAPTLFFLGNAYAKCGDLDKAARAYERALEVDPDYGLARQRLQALRTQLDGAR
jgi:tetratricopeptide (TPR) repeat protein